MSSVVISGDTSGAITLQAPAVSGNTTLTLPTTTGTVVVANGAQTIEFADGSASAPSITNSGDTNTGMFFPAADTIAFTEGGTESMRIDSSGFVLIGKAATDITAVGSYIHPTSGIYTTFTISSGTNEMSIYNNTSTGGNARLDFRVANVSKGYIQWNNTNTTYSTTSDYRLKENIAPMAGALDKVAQLKPVTYTWKFDGSNGQGFIAHELQEVVPEAVTGEKDAVDDEGKPKYQGIDTSFLVATLTKAIQELKAIVDEQAEKIKALEAK